MNKKEQYDQLLKEVETDEFYTRISLDKRYNRYFCNSCGKYTTTQDVDRGVTYAMIGCHHCSGIAHSQFYRVPSEKITPDYEWYRPTYEEFITLSESDQEHILKGGLMMRKVNS